MQLSQYSSCGNTERYCEQVMDSLLTSLKSKYDYIVIDCGLQHELLTINLPAVCRAAARFNALVVLAVPPFLFVTEKTLLIIFLYLIKIFDFYFGWIRPNLHLQ